MGFTEILIFICASSFFGTAVILGFKVYFMRKMDKESVYKGLINSRRFFPKVSEKFFFPFSETARVCVSCFNGVCSRGGKHYRRFSDNMRGKHEIKTEGVSGYWEEVNGYRNELNNGIEEKNGKKEK